MNLDYQRWLELDLPAGMPVWSWPVALGDGRTILTLLYRPLAKPGEKGTGPSTIILELSAQGDAKVWGPGAGYEAGVIFYANQRDDLFGLDLRKTGKVYVCRPDGTHLATLEMPLRMGNLVAPQVFFQAGDNLIWMSQQGLQTGSIEAGKLLVNTQPTELAADPQRLISTGPDLQGARFPHTHVTQGWLYIFDWDPLGRVTRYRLTERQ